MTPNDNKSSKLAGDILQIYAHADPPTGELAIARAELEALVRAQLGADYSQRKIAEVAQSQRSWRQSQRLLTERLERGELPWEEYIASVRDLTSVMANRCEAILGAADFERLFGIPAKDAPDLFSPLYPEPDESAS